MFSSTYFSQYSSELWYAFQKGLSETSWIDRRFFDQQGLILFFQILFSLFVIVAVYRKRQVLNDSQRWRFLAERPFSAGLFFGTIVFMLFYEYLGFQDTWKLGLTIVGGISFARLVGALYPASWRRRFVYGLIIVYIVTRLLHVIMLPLPLMRLADRGTRERLSQAWCQSGISQARPSRSKSSEDAVGPQVPAT